MTMLPDTASVWGEHTQFNVLDPNCPSRRVLSLLSDKWVLLIIVALSKRGTLRNAELKRMLGDVSQKMLIQTLRQLEHYGMVKRTAYEVVPPHVEYELTELGKSLLVPIIALRDWAEEHVAEIDAIREEYKLR
jgi:DNA-binding HxlR family transcriptional regulator